MPAPRLLVLGASGLLGRSVARAAARAKARELHLVVSRGQPPNIPGAILHRFDLRDVAATRCWLSRVKPELVINCVGIVKSICDDGYQAALLNTLLPHLIADALRPWNGRLLHVSTDCVFSGDRGGYKESDFADPIDLYGRTKLAGEVTESPHLTVRTSFIGLERENAKGLLGWFLAQKGEVCGFRKVIWSGLTTDALAEMLVSLIGRREISGLLHVAGEPIDKFSLLCLLAEIFGRTDLRIKPVDLPVCNRSLQSDRLSVLGFKVLSIRTMLGGLKDGERRHAEVI
jgi:dTDP-4-dehydrorhamnose reductase